MAQAQTSRSNITSDARYKYQAILEKGLRGLTEEGKTVSLGFELLPGARTSYQGTAPLVKMVMERFGLEIYEMAVQVLLLSFTFPLYIKRFSFNFRFCASEKLIKS